MQKPERQQSKLTQRRSSLLRIVSIAVVANFWLSTGIASAGGEADDGSSEFAPATGSRSTAASTSASTSTATSPTPATSASAASGPAPAPAQLKIRMIFDQPVEVSPPREAEPKTIAPHTSETHVPNEFDASFVLPPNLSVTHAAATPTPVVPILPSTPPILTPTPTPAAVAVQTTRPPDLRNRPNQPPPPEAVTMLSPLGSGRARESFTWRITAARLRNDDGGGQFVKGSRVFVATASETFAALATACGANGLSVTDQFEDAGQLAASFPDRAMERYKLVFSVRQIDKDKTVVHAGVDPEKQLRDWTLLDGIFTKTSSILAQKGLL